MITTTRTALTLGAAVLGATVVCPLCLQSADGRSRQGTAASAQVTDTATVRLHISGMFCGSCPTTARLALQKITGVYSAKVTLDDSLGVVRYDPRQVTPDSIVAHLGRLTDYRAKVIADAARTRRPR